MKTIQGIVGVASLLFFSAAPLTAQTVGNFLLAWGAGESNTNIEPEFGQSMVPVGLGDVTTAVAGGLYHSLALKTDGTVVAWGDKTYGQTAVPEGLTGVAAISAGAFHNLALQSDGTVVAWGAGTQNLHLESSVEHGQAAVPKGLATLTADVIIPDNTMGLISTVRLVTDTDEIVPGMAVTGPGLSVGIGAVVLAKAGTTITLSKHNLNTAAMSATLTFSSAVVGVAAGYYHSVAVKSDGTVIAWGDPAFCAGASTVPPGLTNVIAVAAGNEHTVVLKRDGTVQAWGRVVEGQTTVPVGLTGVTAIAAGGDFTLALKSNGTVVAWGDNANGQVTGVPTVDVPYSATANPIPGLTGVTAIAAGADHAVALLSDGSLRTWGKIWNGTQYIDVIVPASLGTATAVAAGGYHTLSINSPPAISRQPQSQVVVFNQGNTVVFSVIPSGTGPFTYQWQKDGVNLVDGPNISGATTATLTLTNVVNTSAGTYRVIISNSAGSVTSAEATLSDGGLMPVIIVHPMNVTANQGTVANVEVQATGGALTYQWRKNGVVIHDGATGNGSTISGATQEVLTFTNIQPGDLGSYSVVAYNSAGSASSKVATLRVIPVMVVITPTITSDLSPVLATKGVPITDYQITANTQATGFSAKGLPPGLKLNSKTGVISGKPSKTGRYLVKLKATAKGCGPATANKLFEVL